MPSQGNLGSCGLDSRALLNLLLLLATCAAPSWQADLICFSSDRGRASKGKLDDSFGISGLTSIPCTTECYELTGKSDTGFEQAYSAGCLDAVGADCPKQDFTTVKCVKCSVDRCNNEMAKKIQASNRLCYYSVFTDRSRFGDRRVWCADGINHCLYRRLNIRGYLEGSCAGGSSLADCSDTSVPMCQSCSTQLCNMPAHRKAEGSEQSFEYPGGGRWTLLDVGRLTLPRQLVMFSHNTAMAAATAKLQTTAPR